MTNNSTTFNAKRSGRCPRKILGFTLVELLLVSAIIAVLSASLYRSLSVGLKVWERSRVFSVEEDIMIFFDKLTMDLRNSSNFSLFEFEGDSSRIAFSAIVTVPMGHGSSKVTVYADQIGRVQYGLNSAERAIYRQQANYGQASEGDFGAKKVLARPVDRLSFRYYDRNENGLTIHKLDQDILPAAAEVSVRYKDTKGRFRVLKRLINLPLSF